MNVFKSMMIMMKANKQHFCSKLCSNFVTFLPIILILVLFSFFFSISKSFPFLLTISIALLSTVFLVTLTKKKGPQNENLLQDKLQKEELQQPSLDVIQTELNQQSETAENHHEQKAEAQSDYSFPSQQANLQSDSSSFPSDSESSTGSIMGGNFEIDQNGYQNVSSSNSLASDTDDDEEEEEEEDSLIEINLPSSHFSVSDLTEEPKQTLESMLPDFLPESIFKKQGLMELLAEINDMNEDENLIEIDISMGSDNSQGFRLKQELAYLGNQYVLSD